MVRYTLAKNISERSAASYIGTYYRQLAHAHGADELIALRQTMMEDRVFTQAFSVYESDGTYVINDGGATVTIQKEKPVYPKGASDEVRRRIDLGVSQETEHQYRERIDEALRLSLLEGLDSAVQDIHARLLQEGRPSTVRSTFQYFFGKNLKEFATKWFVAILFLPITIAAVAASVLVNGPVRRLYDEKKKAVDGIREQLSSTLAQEKALALTRGELRKSSYMQAIADTLEALKREADEKTQESEESQQESLEEVLTETNEAEEAISNETRFNRLREMDQVRQSRRMSASPVFHPEPEMETIPVLNEPKPAAAPVASPDIVAETVESSVSESIVDKCYAELDRIISLAQGTDFLKDGFAELYKDSIALQAMQLEGGVPGVKEAAQASLEALHADLIRERISLQTRELLLNGHTILRQDSVKTSLYRSLDGLDACRGKGIPAFLMQNINGNYYGGVNQLILLSDYVRHGYSVPVYLTRQQMLERKLTPKEPGINLYFTDDAGKVIQQKVYNIEAAYVGFPFEKNKPQYRASEEFKVLRMAFEKIAHERTQDTGAVERYLQLLSHARPEGNPAVTDAIARAASGLGSTPLSKDTALPSGIAPDGIFQLITEKYIDGDLPADDRLFDISGEATVLMSGAFQEGICPEKGFNVEEVVKTVPLKEEHELETANEYAAHDEGAIEM